MSRKTVTNIFFSKEMYSGDVHQVRRICKIFSNVWGSRATSPNTFTGEIRLYTQHFAANWMSGKIRV